jgi:transketolase
MINRLRHGRRIGLSWEGGLKQQTSIPAGNAHPELEEAARRVRRDIVWMIHKAGDGHPGASLSVTDILVALYFQVMRIDPQNLTDPDRDRFILSKGHSCPALYATLARRGYFSPDELTGLRSLCSMLQGHPDMNKTPGIDSTSGSLGNGLGIGLGMALAARITGRSYFTYVITGDGELGEGVIWEAAMAAANQNAGSLIAFVDNNRMQSGGTVEEIGGVRDIPGKFAAFGWHVQAIDGHDFSQILAAIDAAKGIPDQPSVVVCHTEKGHGVPFMVGDNSWHKRVPTEDEVYRALTEIGG